MTQVPIVMRKHNTLNQHFTEDWRHYPVDALLNIDPLLHDSVEYIQVVIILKPHLELGYFLADKTKSANHHTLYLASNLLNL